MGAGDNSESVDINLDSKAPYMPVLGAFACETNVEQVESSGETTCDEVKCPYSKEGPRSSKHSRTSNSEADFSWEEVSLGNKRGFEMMDDSDSSKDARELKRAAIERNLKKKERNIKR